MKSACHTAREAACHTAREATVLPKIEKLWSFPRNSSDFLLTILFAYVVIIVFKPVFYWSATKILIHFKFSPKPFPFFRDGLYSSSCQSWQFRFNEECKEPLHKIGLKSFQKVKITFYLQGRSQDFSKGGGSKIQRVPTRLSPEYRGFFAYKKAYKGGSRATHDPPPWLRPLLCYNIAISQEPDNYFKAFSCLNSNLSFDMNKVINRLWDRSGIESCFLQVLVSIVV